MRGLEARGTGRKQIRPCWRGGESALFSSAFPARSMFVNVLPISNPLSHSSHRMILGAAARREGTARREASAVSLFRRLDSRRWEAPAPLRSPPCESHRRRCVPFRRRSWDAIWPGTLRGMLMIDDLR